MGSVCSRGGVTVSVAAAPVGCAISFSDELEDFSFFFSFTFDFLLFGCSYSRDRVGKKKRHSSEQLSDSMCHGLEISSNSGTQPHKVPRCLQNMMLCFPQASQHKPLSLFQQSSLFFFCLLYPYYQLMFSLLFSWLFCRLLLLLQVALLPLSKN